MGIDKSSEDYEAGFYSGIEFCSKISKKAIKRLITNYYDLGYEKDTLSQEDSLRKEYIIKNTIEILHNLLKEDSFTKMDGEYLYDAVSLHSEKLLNIVINEEKCYGK